MEYDQSKIETKLTEEIMLIFSELGKEKVNEIIKLDTHDYNMVYSYVHKVVINHIKELEGTIENNTTELIHRAGDLTHDFWYFCAECLENFEMDENFNYCPNCGRKIVR